MKTITKEQFEAYESVRECGDTNMFDTRRVSDLTGGYLSKSDVITIMKNYTELREVYTNEDGD